jgi:hypothetical protein
LRDALFDGEEGLVRWLVWKNLAYLLDAVFITLARDIADNDWVSSVLSTGTGAVVELAVCWCRLRVPCLGKCLGGS